MGEFITTSKLDISERQLFVKALINDIEALELMLNKELFEDDVTRIGAEQELCIVNKHFQPLPVSLELLDMIDDEHFTHELAKYNLEINLDPLVLENTCFTDMESRLRSFVDKAQDNAAKLGASILLTGILPTISKKEVNDSFITPIPRYFALNNALKQQKGGDFTLRIHGVDEVSMHHNSVMFEACNTSFQLHLQIPSCDFIPSYNWAQALAGPILSVCCNSPLLLGRELWHETRIALFQQSLDTRKTSYALKDQSPRVDFGTDWEKDSVVKIYKNDISKHRILLTKPIKNKATDILDQGKIPKLEALSLHNGTVYRWNRPCYGLSDGKPHLRIENRYLPSGPSITDEIANFVLWIGLMKGRPSEFDNMPGIMDFKDAKNNFFKAARYGKESVLLWKGQEIPAVDLMKNILIPMAKDGLAKSGIHPLEIEKYLGVIESRLQGQTGAQWQLSNLRTMLSKIKLNQCLSILTKYLHSNERSGHPVHLWPPIPENIGEGEKVFVREIMSTQLLTLHKDDVASMALAIMQWNNIHHIPVEDDAGELTGLLTWSHLENTGPLKELDQKKVSDIMIREVITAVPDTKIKLAITMMEENQIGCLPIISANVVVGIISKRDL